MSFVALLPREAHSLPRLPRYGKSYLRNVGTRTDLRPPSSSPTSREEVEKQGIEMHLKYAEKLHKKMELEGVQDVAALKAKISQRNPTSTSAKQPTVSKTASKLNTPSEPIAYNRISQRTDGSPLKPLGEILNISKILDQPHSSEVIHQLWTGYHSSKDGPGFLSATIPAPTYLEMIEVAQKYPLFVVPLPRDGSEKGQAWEFYLLQWAFFERPPEPRSSTELLSPLSAEPRRNLRASTVLFTPLQEFKLHQSFARPFLVMSHYTDLSHSHGIVLLRGEVTPSENNPGNGLLSKQDAHMLAMALQRFYLHSWHGDDVDSISRRQLLSGFHQNPTKFEWEKLIDVSWRT